jgi:small subunit ribosomal protein S3
MNTIRSDLDYAIEEAHTTYGLIGVKVWINRGEIFKKGLNNQITPPKPTTDFRGNRRGGKFNRNSRSNNANRKPAPAAEAAPAKKDGK